MGRFNYSLRSLLAAIAVVGIGAALWVAEPSWKLGAVEALLLAWVLGSVVALSVHSNGRVRTFWIGVGSECVLPIAVLTVGGDLFGYDIDGYDFLQVILHRLSFEFHPVLLAWAFAPVVGLLCVFTHWLFIRSAGPAEPRD